MWEYKVIILDLSPEDTEAQLKQWSDQGWIVICAYCEDRIIIGRKA